MNPSSHLRAVGLWMSLAFFALSNAWGQRYTFRQYGAAEGLSNLSVICLLQDRTGYIWAGTENGLFRYDGSVFRSYGLADGLPSMKILALAEAPDGSIWAATLGGAARIVRDRFKMVETGHRGTARDVKFDRSGQVYLALFSGLVQGIPDGKGGFRFSMIAPGVVRAMALSDDGLWFSRDAGSLWHLQGGKTEQAGAREGLPSDAWQAIARDSLGNLWVRSFTRLYELPRGESKFVDRSEGVPHARHVHLDADSRGRLYVATVAGVVVISGAERTYIDAAHGLPGDTVESVLMDRDESLWIGMQGAGLSRRLGHGEWSSWKKEDGLPHNIVWSVLHHSNGTLWVGTSGGLSIFDAKGKLTHLWNRDKGLLGDDVDSIRESPGGDVFVALNPGGVSRFTPEGALRRNFGADAGLTPPMVALAIDRNNRLWVGGEGALYRSGTPIDGKQNLKFESMAVPGLNTRTMFTGIVATKEGTVWISSTSGLLRFDGADWKRFTEADGLKGHDLSGISDAVDELYVTYTNPLGFTRLRMQGEHLKVTHITVKDGLSSNLVYAVALDGGGRLWASTDNGVSALEQGRWQRYGHDNGLIWDDCDVAALFIDKQDNVWIGTSGGLSRFALLPYALPALPPAVVLASIQDGTREYQSDDQPSLPHTDNSLLLRFSGLNYADETHPRFRYRLLGYERAWHETQERSIRFAGLPAGHYVFEVNAMAPNGMMSPASARFIFSVKRAWWQTWWFSMLCVLVVALLTRAIWKFRVRVLLRQKMLLERQVAERTDELRESHRQLEQLAYYDTLTSLPNRRMYAEQLKMRIEIARRDHAPFALVLIDLDRFKYVNDTFGHDVGDEVLVQAAARLRAVVRQSDCLARMGGDEFAILLNSAANLPGIGAFCARIVESFKDGIDLKGQHLPVGTSVGVAMFTPGIDTQEQLYKAADLALYEAKQKGRGTYAFYRSPEQDVLARTVTIGE